MEISIQSQVHIFVITLLCGVLIGLIYDFYRLFRYYSRPKRIKTFIQDLIFWLLLSVIIILVVNKVNEGELRGFIFIGFTIGIIIYSRLLSKKIIRLISHIVDLIIANLKKSFKFILKPLLLLRRSAKNIFKDTKKYLNLPKIFYDNMVKSVKTISKKK